MDWVAALAGMPAALAAKGATSYHSSPSQGFGSTRRQVADDRNYRLGLLRLTLGLEPPAKRIGCSTTTRLCGCAGGCASSTRSGDARAELIHSRLYEHFGLVRLTQLGRGPSWVKA